jgi:hypothetical protein
MLTLSVRRTTMSDFEDRLQKAIQRGQQFREAESGSQPTNAVTEEQLRSRHSELRNDLTDHIEKCLRKLCDHFPGFEFSSVLNEKGWGARITRDDLILKAGVGKTEYSRLEILIRPFSDAHILEIATKGTIRNRESLNRSNFRFLTDAVVDLLRQMIDSVVLEFAEQYSAQR